MIEQTMELRGIPLPHLVSYLIECGGAAKSEVLPILVKGDRWQAVLLREETVTITSRFQVNAVFIYFSATDEDSFERLMKQFRVKVMRVGG
ncbi:hypothetical protein AN963_01970 [Brevibacillus choshinensis]|uniref:Molybdopterin cofactor biosynthesis MoaD-related C-terminal domain-containing protein n=1 Tax=Brevibacillus choshinensis TaxID=54911 RepID=A0ABR5NAL8_BRECH|nr:hypothetical protein [Brevibacillus choshinensis]KQL48595.1 hypothetical protein AN963_01970 [Brevibacillus choshinensis]